VAILYSHRNQRFDIFEENRLVLFESVETVTQAQLKILHVDRTRNDCRLAHPKVRRLCGAISGTLWHQHQVIFDRLLGANF
jgi:hypothetical protein